MAILLLRSWTGQVLRKGNHVLSYLVVGVVKTEAGNKRKRKLRVPRIGGG